MTDKQMFMLDCYRYGATATLSQVTGTTCGCQKSSGSSREWHRQNPTEDDCNGTGQIDTTTTTTSVKAFFTNRLQSLMQFLNKYNKSEIGELDIADLFMFGTAKAADASFVSLVGLEESNTNRENKVIYDSQDYTIRLVYQIGFTEEVGQVALLKKKT